MAKNNDTDFFWQSKYTTGKDGQLESESFVDGFDLDSNSKILQSLHSFLN